MQALAGAALTYAGVQQPGARNDIGNIDKYIIILFFINK